MPLNPRNLRKVCGQCDTQVMHWIHYAKAEPIPKVLVEASVSFDINKKLFLHDGSISELDCDAIVVTANKMLRKMPGMAQVFKEAGENNELEDAASKQGPVQFGDVVQTPGFNLCARNVLFAVGPGRMESGDDKEILKKCYDNCLEWVVKEGYKSIAFPCISTGGNNISSSTASIIACRTVREWLETHHSEIESVTFCRYSDRDKIAYDKTLHSYFPVELPS